MLDRVTLNHILDCAGVQARNYSGRGMYGAQCYAVTVPNAAALYAELVQVLLDEIEEKSEIREWVDSLIKDAQTDSMGHDIVVYWPKWEWEWEGV